MSDRTLEERRWLTAVESADFGVWDLDPGLEMVHYSPAWKARLGFPRIEAADLTWFWRCRVHPDDFGAMAGALRAHIDGDVAQYESRFRLRINGSGYRTVLSRGRVVERDARGNATRMVGTMVDLTARPVAAALQGLPTEVPAPAIEVPRVPFHVVLGARETHRLIGLVDDLLDRALHEGAAAQPR